MIDKIQKLRFLGEGRHRRTYLSKSGRYVFKLPQEHDGVLANQQEYKNYLRGATDFHGVAGDYFARCRLLHNNVLVMEYVQPIGETYGFIQDNIVRLTYTSKGKLYKQGRRPFL